MFKLEDLLRLYRSEGPDDAGGGAPGEENPGGNEPPENDEGSQQQQEAPNWATKRLGEMAARRRAAEERAARLEAELESLKAQQQEHRPTPVNPEQFAHLTPEDIDRLASLKAESIVSQREQQRQQQAQQAEFNNRLAAVDKEATDKYGDEYAKAIQRLQLSELGGAEFVATLVRNKNAAALLTWLGQEENLEVAARLHDMSPVDMAFELAELAPKAAKHFATPRSKAPAPLDTLSGSRGASPGKEPDPSDTQAWIAWRNEQAKARRSERR